jgi:hypothetical protein
MGWPAYMPASRRHRILERSGDCRFLQGEMGMPVHAPLRPECYQESRAETCSWREVVEVLVITPAEAEGAEVADE